jgi:hypothetical protein
VEVDPDHPLHGTHRDDTGSAYFEFATDFPGEVERVVREFGYDQRVELTTAPAPLGAECANCGNVAGEVQPPVCPNCGFQDITPCPVCHTPVPRQRYVQVGGDRFQCPHCESRVRLRFNNPLLLPDGSYNQPLVLVEEAAASHALR